MRIESIGDIIACYWFIAGVICLLVMLNDKEDKGDFLINLLAYLPVAFLFGGIVFPLYFFIHYLNKDNK